MKVQPYLFFEGRAEEAAEFYTKVLGAKVEMLMKYSESPERNPMLPAGSDNKVMHMQLNIGDSIVMGSDGMCGGGATFNGFSLSLIVKDGVEAAKTFAALSAGGQVRMPLAKTFFSSNFGMLADKFGIGWMIMAEK